MQYTPGPIVRVSSVERGQNLRSQISDLGSPSSDFRDKNAFTFTYFSEFYPSILHPRHGFVTAYTCTRLFRASEFNISFNPKE